MTTERRQYFRIEDRALIKYRVIGEDELERERRFIYLNEIRASNLHAALLGIDLRLQEAIDQVRDDTPAIAQALDLLNRKVNLIERVVSLETGEAAGQSYREHEPTEVNLSGGGIALAAATPLALNAYLAIDLVLMPAHHPMRAIGRVVDCRKSEQAAGFAIAVEFDEIRDEDREILIQHVIKRQSALLREQRQGEAA